MLSSGADWMPLAASVSASTGLFLPGFSDPLPSMAPPSICALTYFSVAAPFSIASATATSRALAPPRTRVPIGQVNSPSTCFSQSSGQGSAENSRPSLLEALVPPPSSRPRSLKSSRCDASVTVRPVTALAVSSTMLPAASEPPTLAVMSAKVNLPPPPFTRVSSE